MGRNKLSVDGVGVRTPRHVMFPGEKARIRADNDGRVLEVERTRRRRRNLCQRGRPLSTAFCT